MTILTDLREFFFPRICAVCGKKLTLTEEGVCVACLQHLPYTRLQDAADNSMEKCFWGRFPIERAFSLFYFEKGGAVADLLHAMKYHGQKQLCRSMGKLIGAELAGTSFFCDIDYLIPVPLFPTRQKQRGYNQSRLLSDGISLLTGIPVREKFLIRLRNNATQTHKSSFGRWENVEGLFSITPGTFNQLENKHILLVDDVLTTGATLVSCADAFAGITGIRISVVTLAWAK
ncbi:ComF family protein [uncultured Bacteroides sp.]|uniref:ComF family protein n=1 Tax=uncultured Bacteroides sp. TaxID=162156 RepID=UPI00261692A5|nr:ComF family protein [uncultured Bacteroides sp.]